jgi:hypothetical protein
VAFTPSEHRALHDDLFLEVPDMAPPPEERRDHSRAGLGIRALDAARLFSRIGATRLP